MDRGAWQAIVHEVTKSWTQLSNCTHIHKLRPAGRHFFFFSHSKGPESKANPEESRERQNPDSIIEIQDTPRPEASTPLYFPATPAYTLPFASSYFGLSFCHLNHWESTLQQRENRGYTKFNIRYNLYTYTWSHIYLPPEKPVCRSRSSS